MDDETTKAATAVLDAFRRREWMAATAESCTGGLVAGALTEIAGSSDVVDRGFVTYSNEATQQRLGVPAETLATHGALGNSRAHAAVSITGVAGPGGGSAEKPVGLVHFAAATRDGGLLHVERRFGDIGRAEVRRRSVIEALSLLKRCVEHD
jgi:nicotinamide-nucleotide amidase